MTGSALYGPLAEYYDRIYGEKDYDAEARSLGRLARTENPGARSLLDVACGTGRHLAAFRSVFRSEGLDESPAMLALARRRLGRSVPLHRADMRSFDLHRQFDVLVCLFSAIGYLTTSTDRRQAFRTFARHLAPGGVALIEGWILPSEFRADSVHLRTYDGPDAKIARLSVATRRRGLSTIEMEYLVGEPKRGIRHYREVHRNALVAPGTMLADLRSAGFEARAILTGIYRTRGLYVARLPRTGLARRGRAASR